MRQIIIFLAVLLFVVSPVYAYELGNVNFNIEYNQITDKDVYPSDVPYYLRKVYTPICFECDLPVMVKYDGTLTPSYISLDANTKTNINWRLEKLIQKDDLKNKDITVLTKITENIDVPVETCSYNIINDTEVPYNCKINIEVRQREVWKWISIFDTTLNIQKGEPIFINFRASRSPTLENYSTDYIPTIAGFEFTELAWFNTSNLKRKPITIGSSNGTFNGYALSETILYDADMQSDFSDIAEFTCRNSTGDEVSTGYWMETYTASTSALMHWNATYLNASNKCWFYYGNASATSKSDPTTVFDYWNDMDYTDTADASTDGWTMGGSGSKAWNLTSGSPTSNGKTIWASNNGGGGGLDMVFYKVLPKGFSGNWRMRMNYAIMGSSGWLAVGLHNSSYTVTTVHWSGATFMEDATYHRSVFCDNDSCPSDGTPGNWANDDDNFHKGELQYVANNNARYIWDGLSVLNFSNTEAIINGHDIVKIYSDSNGKNGTIDWIFIDQQVFPSPTVTVGSEESVPAVSVSYKNPTPANTTILVNYAYVNVTANSTDADIDSCVVSVDGTKYDMVQVGTGTDITCYYNATSLSEGHHTIQITSNDTNNVTGTSTIRGFTVDNNDPVVAIQVPATGSVLNSTNVTINFTVTETNMDSCWYSITSTDSITGVSGVWNQSNVSLAGCSNITISASTIGNITLTIYSNSTGNRIGSATRSFKIPYVVLKNESFTGTVFETGVTSFYITFNESINTVTTGNATLTYNGTTYVMTRSYVNNTANYTINHVSVPLVINNGSTVNFYINHTYTSTNGTAYTTQYSTLTQAVKWSYEVNNITSDKGNYTTGEQINITTNIRKYVNNATIVVNITYNNADHTTTETVDTAVLSRFLMENYVPVVAVTSNFTYNASVYVTFGGITRTMYSLNGTFNVSVLSITNCSVGDQILNFTIYNETTRTDKIAANMNLLFTVWKEGSATHNNFTFEAAGSNSYVYCLSPTGETAYVNSTIEYWNHTNTQRDYFLVNAEVSTPVENINLYVLDGSLAYITKLNVQNSDASDLANGIVRIQRFYVANNSFITIAMSRTDFEGTGITRLAADDVFYRFIVYDSDGTLLQEFQSTKVVPDATTNIAEFNLRVSSTPTGQFYTYSDRIGYSCSYVTGTDTITCTVSDSTGLVVTTRLLVEKLGVVTWTTICDDTLTGTTNTHTCTLGSDSAKNETYRYQLTASTSTSSTLLKIDFVEHKGASLYGMVGLFAALVLFLLFVMLGNYDPAISMTMGIISLIIAYASGMLVIGLSALISIVVVFALLIWKMRGS